jgi:Na+/glutamate symporter
MPMADSLFEILAFQVAVPAGIAFAIVIRVLGSSWKGAAVSGAIFAVGMAITALMRTWFGW